MAGATRIESGEFAGWLTWQTDPYEVINGPFVYRVREDGSTICAMRVEPRHCNNAGATHGGLLMTFADFCLFAIGQPAMDEMFGVTVSCTSQFLGPAFPGDLIEATGRVSMGGKSLVFVEVDMKVGERPVLSVSGIIKRIKAKPA